VKEKIVKINGNDFIARAELRMIKKCLRLSFYLVFRNCLVNKK
jgi:hypothetical protein